MKTILVDAVHVFIIEGEGIFKDMQVLLDSFENKKIILTNANNEEKEKYGLINMPYEVFTLEHNPEKNDPKYFKKMLDRFNLSSNDVVYFEHNEEAIKSAKSIGIKTHYYDKDKKDLESLKNFLIENLN